MSLLDKIRADQLAARKNREADKASLLTTLIGEAAMKGKNSGNRESTDSEVEEVIRKFLKGNRENMAIAGDRRDGDWCDRLDAEREVLESYLPKQLSVDEIRAKIQGQEKSKPALMKYLKENFAGLYDGKAASQVVDEYIKS